MGLIVIFIPIFVLTLLIVLGVIVRFVRSLSHSYEFVIPVREEERKTWDYRLSWFGYRLSPIVVSLIAPIAGFLIIKDLGTISVFDDTMYTPLHHDHMLTILVFYLVSLGAYWISAAAKKRTITRYESFFADRDDARVDFVCGIDDSVCAFYPNWFFTDSDYVSIAESALICLAFIHRTEEAVLQFAKRYRRR